MSTTELVIDAVPDRVWAMLADGWRYTNWVVGASHLRAVDAAWPAPGTRIHHAVGAWPLLLRDQTQVEECETGRRLVLLARGRPFGSARVVLMLEPVGTAQCRVTMSERPVSGVGRLGRNPAADLLITRRNDESLARLAALTEARTTP